LGKAWRAVLTRVASIRSRNPQWWRQQQFRRLVSRHIPHIPELYEGMAEGAKIDPKKLVIPTPQDVFAGCTSFAMDASATRNGRLLCGQTKDTPINRIGRYQVLRIAPTDAPASLTLTYPGMLFGHGFVAGGCAVFRNSLHAGKQAGKSLPYGVWGLLSLHCTSVAEVIALLERFGVNESFHCTVCDASGSIAGIENGAGGVAVLQAKDGIYTHGNNVLSGSALKRHELVDRSYVRFSTRRTSRLAELLSRDRTRLTPQLVLAALSDHQGYPRSICNHESDDFSTTAAIVAEPSTGRLWVSSGPPCENWPVEYRLDR
jgi:isopenicillin-N N-acyltransferase-like protein